MAPKEHRKKVSVYPGANIGLDHNLLIATLKFRGK